MANLPAAARSSCFLRCLFIAVALLIASQSVVRAQSDTHKTTFNFKRWLTPGNASDRKTCPACRGYVNSILTLDKTLDEMETKLATVESERKEYTDKADAVAAQLNSLKNSIDAFQQLTDTLTKANAPGGLEKAAQDFKDTNHQVTPADAEAAMKLLNENWDLAEKLASGKEREAQPIRQSIVAISKAIVDLQVKLSNCEAENCDLTSDKFEVSYRLPMLPERGPMLS